VLSFLIGIEGRELGRGWDVQDCGRECCTEIAGFQGESNRLVKVEDVHLLNRLGGVSRLNKNKYCDRGSEISAY